MGKITELDLKKHIREKTMENCYLFYGDESYLKQFYVNKIIKKFVPAGTETFSLRKYDGKDNTLGDMAEGMLSMPFMSEYTVNIVHDFPFDSYKKDDKDELKDLLKQKNETSITIFWMDSIDVNTKTEKWVVDLFSKYACAVDFKKATGRELRKILCAYAQKLHSNMDDNVAAYLVEVSGDSLNVLFNEIEKACNYVGEGNTITKEHIDLLAVRTLEARVFDLSKFILNGNPQKALELFHSLILQKEEPIEIFNVILMSFIDIYRAKISLSGGKSEQYAANFYDYRNKEFRLSNGSRFSRKISDSDLRECFDEFADSDMRLKSTGQSGEMIIERLIVKLSLILAR